MEKSLTDSARTVSYSPKHTKPWWREWQAAALCLLVAAAYFVRSGDVSLRGEEPTRVRIGMSMLETGDWIVPRIQGEPLGSRPPLQNWLIVLSALVCRSCDAWALRLPTVLSMLLTTLLIYAYGRTFLSRTGALAAAAAFATFGELFTTGCQAETDMMFTAFVSGSLLLWHFGLARGWHDAVTWSVGYAVMALGLLCKGPQAPIYFLGSITVFLLVSGQWRRGLSWSHLLGIGVGAAIFLAWFIPCYLVTDWFTAKTMIFNDTASRFGAWDLRQFSMHLLTFPLEVFGCTLPWSPLWLCFLSRPVRRWTLTVGNARQGLFLIVCLAVAVPSIWIPPDGQTRYLTPIYPCLALAIGMVLESSLALLSRPSRAPAAALETETAAPRANTDIQGASAAPAAAALPPFLFRQSWRMYTLFMAIVMAGAALALLAAAVVFAHGGKFQPWAEPPLAALAFGLSIFLLAWMVAKSGGSVSSRNLQIGTLAVAAFMTILFTGYFTNVRVRRSQDQAADVARLKERLPAGEPLVAFGRVDLLFVYYYGQEIPPAPAHADVRWFCFESLHGSKPRLPFAWEEKAVIIMDRYRSDHPERTVVVGRRLPQ